MGQTADYSHAKFIISFVELEILH